MWYVLTIWDETNARHQYKFMDYDDAESRAYHAIDLGAEYVIIENSHTGEILLDKAIY